MDTDKASTFVKRFNELKGTDTNEIFSKKLGISRQTVGFYCAGKRIPDALGIINICEKCGVSSDWLLGIKRSDEIVSFKKSEIKTALKDIIEAVGEIKDRMES